MATLALAGCGRHTTTKESRTIIEKQSPVVETQKGIVVRPPAVVTREIIMEQPAPLRVCAYASAYFSSGTLSCQRGQQYRCEEGTWVRRDLNC